VPLEIVGAVLCNIAHVRPEKGTKTKTEMAELFEERLTIAVYCTASFYVPFCEGALS